MVTIILYDIHDYFELYKVCVVFATNTTSCTCGILILLGISPIIGILVTLCTDNMIEILLINPMLQNKNLLIDYSITNTTY